MKTLKQIILVFIFLLALGCSKESIETEKTTSLETELATKGGGNIEPDTLIITWEFGISPAEREVVRNQFINAHLLISWTQCTYINKEIWVYDCSHCQPFQDPGDNERIMIAESNKDCDL